jgi:hypothetical protein
MDLPPVKKPGRLLKSFRVRGVFPIAGGEKMMSMELFSYGARKAHWCGIHATGPGARGHEHTSDRRLAQILRVKMPASSDCAPGIRVRHPWREIVMETKLASRRQYPRYVVRERTEGRLEGVHEAVLVDISLGGVKIEHAQNIRPGTISPLDLLFHDKKIRLLCRVVWSFVVRQDYDLDGEGTMIYHTGLEFHNPSEPTRQLGSRRRRMTG